MSRGKRGFSLSAVATGIVTLAATIQANVPGALDVKPIMTEAAGSITADNYPGTRAYIIDKALGNDATARYLVMRGGVLMDSTGSLLGRDGLPYGTDPEALTDAQVYPYKNFAYVNGKRSGAVPGAVSYNPGDGKPNASGRNTCPDMWFFRGGGEIDVMADVTEYFDTYQPAAGIPPNSGKRNGTRNTTLQINGCVYGMTGYFTYGPKSDGPARFIRSGGTGFIARDMASTNSLVPNNVVVSNLHFIGQFRDWSDTLNADGSVYKPSAVSHRGVALSNLTGGSIWFQYCYIDRCAGPALNTSGNSGNFNLTFYRCKVGDTWHDASGSHCMGWFNGANGASVLDGGSTESKIRVIQCLFWRNGFKYGDPAIAGNWPPALNQGAFTVTVGSSIINAPNHGKAAGANFAPRSTGSLPAGLNISTAEGSKLYVISSGLTTNTLQVSATPEGPPIVVTSAGSGTFSYGNAFVWDIFSRSWYLSDVLNHMGSGLIENVVLPGASGEQDRRGSRAERNFIFSGYFTMLGHGGNPEGGQSPSAVVVDNVLQPFAATGAQINGGNPGWGLTLGQGAHHIDLHGNIVTRAGGVSSTSFAVGFQAIGANAGTVLYNKTSDNRIRGNILDSGSGATTSINIQDGTVDPTYLWDNPGIPNNRINHNILIATAAPVLTTVKENGIGARVPDEVPKPALTLHWYTANSSNTANAAAAGSFTGLARVGSSVENERYLITLNEPPTSFKVESQLRSYPDGTVGSTYNNGVVTFMLNAGTNGFTAGDWMKFGTCNSVDDATIDITKNRRFASRAASAAAYGFPDTERCLKTYLQAIGITVAGGSDGSNEMITLMKAQRYGAWLGHVMAVPIINYIRKGWGLPGVVGNKIPW